MRADLRAATCCLLLILLTLLSCHLAAAEPKRTLAASASSDKRVALVIGNGKYSSSPLSNPPNDARDMAAALRRIGFDVIEKTDVTQKEMNRAITQFGSKLTSDTVALFFYAGHGMQVKGRNYLIPVDAQIENEASVRSETVDVDAVLDQLSASSLNIVILDACRNNPFERRFRSVGGGLAPMDAPKGTLIAYATAPGRVASDGDGRNGLYTQELLKVIRTPGLEVEKAFKRVRASVARATGDNQIPWEASSLTGEFCFGTCSGNSSPAASPTAPVTDPSALELSYWESIRESRAAAEYQAYLEQYPDGRFAGLARARITSLAPAPIPAPTPVPAPPPVNRPPASAVPAQVAMLTPTSVPNPAARPSVLPDMDFPNKPIRIVVPFPLGASTDMMARSLAQKLSLLVHQPVVVENQPGAGGSVGSIAVAKAPADGYTLLLGNTSTHVITPALYARLPYNPTTDFSSVAYVGEIASVLVVANSVPARTIGELVQLARSKPRSLKIASTGLGTFSHLMATLLQHQTGVQLTHVPYKGFGPALNDLLGGDVDAMFIDLGSALSYIRAGKLRSLAFTSAKRTPLLPELPTTAEVGYANLTRATWMGLYAPAGTPAAVVARLNLLVYQALQDTKTNDWVSGLGMTVSEPAAPELLTSIQRRDAALWGQLIRSAGIRTD